MIFKRKIFKQIEDWNNNYSKNCALLIEGARRIGKTTICNDFANKYYKNNYLLIDFMYVDNKVKELFANMSDLNDFFSNLFLLLHKSIKQNGLIIFDEIQCCPNARQAIKLLIKDGRFNYIETGSLISIRENVKDITIPSEEKRIEMFPMDFEEFLWAFNKEDLANQIRDAYLNKKQINNSAHEILIKEYRKYIALGGMPQVIEHFIKTLSYKSAHEIKMNILKLYKDDLHKHDLLHNTMCESLFDNIPSILMNENSRFIISNGDNKRYYHYQKSLEDLNDSKIVNLINKISDPIFGFELSKVDSFFKLYLCDSGLLVTSILKNDDESIDDVYAKIIFNKSDFNFRKVYESLVAQSLVANDIKPYYLTYSLTKEEKQKRYEIDFIAIIKGKKTAIEVKSGKNFLTSSLNNLHNKYQNISFSKIVISSKQYKQVENTTYIPIYMLFCIK